MPSIAYLDLKYDKLYFTNKIYDNAITLTALVDDCQIGLYDPNIIDLSISYDNGMTWTDIHLPGDSGFYYLDPIYTGQTIMIVGRETHHVFGCYGLHFFSEEDNYFNVSGNLTSLLDTDFALVEREWPLFNSTMIQCFARLFASFNVSNTTYKAYVKDASDLVFTNLDPAPYFYEGMFSNCTSLEKAPKTLSTKINSMHCCDSMFYNCTSLTTAPELPATTLEYRCYSNMFYNCTSLTTAPELPATTLANYCYYSMFRGCTSLVLTPRLPATTLAERCYQYMFNGCRSLTTAPELPATTLANYCYYGMFQRCTSLTTAPELPATTLASNCYQGMFYGCTSLNYIKILATSWPANTDLEDHISNWVVNVAPAGIFVKDINTTYEIDSNSGVPIGWTVYNVGEYIPPTYNVNITVDPTGYGTVSGAGSYQEGSNVVVTATPSTGNRFVGWYNGQTLVSNNTMYIFTINSNVSLTARFEEIVYYNVSLSQDPSVGATLTGAGTYMEGSTVTITASNVFGYDFVGWVVNSTIVSTSMSYTFTLNSNISLTAKYEEFIDYEHTYFTIEALETGGSFGLDFTYLKAGSSIQVKLNNSQWYTITTSTDGASYSQSFRDLMAQLTGNSYGIVNVGDRLSLRRFNRTGVVNGGWDGSCVKITAGVRYIAYGNIASIYPSHDDISNMTDNYYAGINLTTMNTDETYYELFQSSNTESQQKLVDASNLILPFTTLITFAYEKMFKQCAVLTTAPVLPATTLAIGCYQGMFERCTSLTTAPELPATTLASNCYNGMFNDCSSLTTAPVLPATTLASSCYSGMFISCTSLTTAPELPATTLATSCYASMFDTCSSLTTAPELPATTLAQRCYYYMFYGCTSLNSITCLATDISAEYCTSQWVRNVAGSGTFTKDPNTTWSTGQDGIPTGWTVVDAS